MKRCEKHDSLSRLTALDSVPPKPTAHAVGYFLAPLRGFEQMLSGISAASGMEPTDR